jgi:hypothetical protein
MSYPQRTIAADPAEPIGSLLCDLGLLRKGERRQMNESGRREVEASGPLAIDHKGKGRQASKGRKKKTSKVKKEGDSIYRQPDLRDFIERVFETLAIGSFLVYCCWLGFAPKRYLIILIPLGLVFYAGLIIAGRRFYANNEKRRRKGKRYKFFDVEKESEWIFWLSKLGMVGAMFLLGWLWVSNNLKHYWYLTALVPVLILICLIFTPASVESGDGGIDF